MTDGSLQPTLHDRRVLVVEDEYFVADDIARALSKAGAEVVGPVPTREEALGLLSSGARIDAAVLDINLRGDMAYPVADALRERGVPFVFATGYGETAGAPGGFDAPVIRKPYDVTQVAAAVAELLAER